MDHGIKLPFKVGVSPTLLIRGLIASELIHKDQVIERCPAIIYLKNTPVIEQTIFDHYVFDWDETHEALALGYGSLCNHSFEPNIQVDFDMEQKKIVFRARRDIQTGEELFINYNDDSNEPIDPHYLSLDKDLDN